MKYRAEISVLRFLFWLAMLVLLAFIGASAVIVVQVIANA